MESHKYIISGGGTGGHIFPALSIANEIRRRDPQAKFLFVGAKGRMEEEKVPAAGYEILTLPVKGLDRKRLHKNIPILYRLIKGLFTVRKVLKAFAPDIAIGVGGYASAPTLITANLLGVPTLSKSRTLTPVLPIRLSVDGQRKSAWHTRGWSDSFPRKISY